MHLPSSFPLRATNASFFLLATLIVARAHAGANEANGSEAHHLFNPVPRDQRRDFTPDRPGASENPFTVDAGHYHLELGIVSVALDEADGVQTTELALAETKIRAGLVPWLEFQLVIAPYYRREVETSTDRAASDTAVDEFDPSARIGLAGPAADLQLFAGAAGRL